jgi:hypothetical protein
MTACLIFCSDTIFSVPARRSAPNLKRSVTVRSNCPSLLAAHVRTNHVPVVVEAEVRPETIMNTFKSYASRGFKPVWGMMHRIKSEGRAMEAHPMEDYLRDQL